MTRTAMEAQRRQAMHELVNRAYRRELTAALEGLEAKFREWRAGKIDCVELGELLHQHHDGVSRDLWAAYHFSADPAWVLPALIERGVIEESEVPESLRSMLKSVQAG